MCSILPSYSNCNLAPVAGWADKFKYQMRWSSQMHYVNGVGDHPAEKCVFGQEGWQGPPGINVLSAIRNTTMWLEKGYEGAEEALKFLIHFVGDLHQPLHLTGRAAGGNGIKVRFNRRITSSSPFPSPLPHPVQTHLQNCTPYGTPSSSPKRS